ncbi:DMT family transporter [Chitinophaga lutea]
MKQAYIKLHASILLAGFTGLFGKLIALNEGLLVWYRLLFSALLMLLLQYAAGRLQRVTRKAFLRMGAVGVLLALFWIFFYGSIKYANISIGVICFCTVGFFTAWLAPLVNRSAISPQEVLLSGLSIAGIALIFGFDMQYRTGIILGLLCACTGALYTIFNEKLARRYEARTLLLYELIGGLLGFSFLAPFYLQNAPRWVPTAGETGWLLALAFFCTIGMYLLLTEALQQLSAFTVNLSYNLEPVYSIVLAVLFFGEDAAMSTAFAGGLLLIILSVALQSWREWRRR